MYLVLGNHEFVLNLYIFIVGVGNKGTMYRMIIHFNDDE
jgi:hypothetical protein